MNSMSIHDIIELRARIQDAHAGNKVRTLLVRTSGVRRVVAFKRATDWVVLERTALWEWRELGALSYPQLMGIVIRCAYEYDLELEEFNHFRNDWIRRLQK